MCSGDQGTLAAIAKSVTRGVQLEATKLLPTTSLSKLSIVPTAVMSPRVSPSSEAPLVPAAIGGKATLPKNPQADSTRNSSGRKTPGVDAGGGRTRRSVAESITTQPCDDVGV